MKKHTRLLACLPLFFLYFQNLDAQQDATDTLIINELQPVTVTAYRLESTDFTTPLSLSHIGANQLQRGTQQLALDEALAGVPGVFVQNGSNFAQDVRVSIRGFGARSAFGIRGVKILVDGFPESTPDGQAQVDAIDPGSLTGVDVIRSGTGGLYGNASGGSINFNTLKFKDSDWLEVGATAGSFGFQKYQFRTGGGKAFKFPPLGSGNTGRFLYTLNGAYTAIGGYREHGEMKNFLVNGGYLATIDSSFFIRMVMTYVNSPLAQDPGALKQEELDLDREAANANNLKFKADESLWQLRFGVQLTKVFSKKHRIGFKTYLTQRDFENRLAFSNGGIVELGRSFIGNNWSYKYSGKLFRLPWELQAGVELELQKDDRIRFDNNEGEKGDRTFDQLERFSNNGAFLVQKISLTDRLLLLPGIRFDWVRLEADDHFLEDGDDSGERNFIAFNPMLGLSFLASQNSSIYLNASRNFETPTLTELVNATGGGFNPDLEPQTSKTLEIGTKSQLADGRLKVEVALFHIWLEQEFVPFEYDSTGRIFYRNAATSTRRGIEIGLTAFLGRHFFGSVNYTFSDFSFKNYEVSGNNFDGNTLPGVPRHMGSVEFRYVRPKGWYFSVGGQSISEIFTNDSNENNSRAYLLANARVGFIQKFETWQLEPFLGVNNLFDARYNANVRINAGFDRFYEPAPGRNFFGGLKVRFSKMEGTR